MNEVKIAFVAMLHLLATISRFNAFAAVFAGWSYGMLAVVLDREFVGFGSTQISLLGVACFVVFFGLSIGFATLGNCLVSDVEEVGGSKITAP